MPAKLDYLEPEERDGRGWKTPPPQRPRGCCRWCAWPIVVPVGGLLAAALELHSSRRDDTTPWEVCERRLEWTRAALPEGQVVHRTGGWHPWCSDAWAWIVNPNWALTKLLEEDPRCRECRIDLAELGERRYRALWAHRDAADWCHRNGVEAPAGWGDYRRSPVLDGLRAMGFHTPGQSLAELDHVKPLWAGGLHERSNLQALCQPCHKRKSKREAAQRARAKKQAARRAETRRA